MQKLKTKKQICEERFKKLKEYIGKEIICNTLENDKYVTLKDKLINVTNFNNITTVSYVIPFIGLGTAISSITSIEGEVLYLNDTLSSSYNARKQEEIAHYKQLIFGYEITNNKTKKTQNSYLETIKLLEKLRKEIISDTNNFIKENLNLIDSDLYLFWQVFINNTMENSYNSCIIYISVAIMKKLKEGLSFKEVEELLYSTELGITAFQLSSIITTVCYFYKDGEKFKNYFNSKNTNI